MNTDRQRYNEKVYYFARAVDACGEQQVKGHIGDEAFEKFTQARNALNTHSTDETVANLLADAQQLAETHANVGEDGEIDAYVIFQTLIG